MNQEVGLNILIRAVQNAQKKGVYDLQESSLIYKAITVFLTNKPNEQDLINDFLKKTQIETKETNNNKHEDDSFVI